MRDKERKALEIVLLFMMIAIPPIAHAQMQQSAKTTAAEPVPEPAIPAILAAFDKYEVVGLPQGHGMQDLNNDGDRLTRPPVRVHFPSPTRKYHRQQAESST